MVKDDKGRKFLSDLKNAYLAYNDLPFTYTCNKFYDFQKDDAKILFVHIRECEEIQRYQTFVKENAVPCVTMLVERKESPVWENDADKDVEFYDYDYIFYNDEPIDEASESFYKLIGRIAEEENIHLH